MKHKFLILIPLLSLCLTGCGLLEALLEKDTDVIHTKSYEPVTGKYVLYEASDKRISDISNTYFDIDGTNMTLKYYENGVLKKEGEIQKLLTRNDYIGSYSDVLHFNVKTGSKTADHICTYTESLEPINQFRIIQEYYNPGDALYYLSELPYIMGTYVREGEEYVAEKPHTNDRDYLTPTDNDFTAAIDGKYALNDNTYFYFLNPRGWSTPNGGFINSFFQYYSPDLNKPIEGFIWGYSYDYSNTQKKKTFYIRTYRDSVDWGDKLEGRVSFGYDTFDDKGRMIEHFGEIDFSNGVLNSFSFEHLSRPWTDDEWNPYLKGEVDTLPDNILYEYVGGTYTKVAQSNDQAFLYLFLQIQKIVS